MDEVYSEQGDEVVPELPNPNAIVDKKPEMEDMDEMEILKKKAGMLSDDDFMPVSEGYGNELCVYAEDFPELAAENRGSEFMLVVRGAIKGIAGGIDAPEKLELYVWDAAFVHGKKSMRLGGGGRFEAVKKALMGQGKSEDSAEAIAAAAGRKRYGKGKFQKMAAAGLRRYFRNK